MKKLLLALSSVCLIPTNALVVIGCGADKASQQTVKNNINNFLSDSNESDKLILNKANTSKLNSFGIIYQDDAYQFDKNKLTIEAIKQGLELLINNNDQLPLIFNAQQTLLDTESAENETALLVESQGCEILENNLIYKWNISFYINKFKNDEFVWVKTSEKSVELYAEIVDYQQVINEEVKPEEVKPEEVKPEEVKADEVNDKVSDEIIHNREKNQQVAKRYKEIISNWNEDLITANKTSNTVEELIDGIKENKFFYDEIDEEVIEDISIKIKDINAQNYMQETAFLSAEKYTVDVEFKIGKGILQVTETASFEIKISDHNFLQKDESFTCENSQTFENTHDNSNPKVTSTNEINDSGFESELNEEDKIGELDDENKHADLDPEEIIDSSSTDTLTIQVNAQTKVEQVIAKIKEKYPSLSEANITLKDSKNNKVRKNSDIKFANYQVYQDKKSLVLNLQIEELILTSKTVLVAQSEAVIFDIFNDIQLDKIMANHCSAKDLKDMIGLTDQFNDLKSKIKNEKNIEMKIKDKDMNDIEDKTNLLHEQYHIEILVLLKESNIKAIINFKVDVPNLSKELSSQLEKYVSDIESVTVKIKTKKDSTEDKTKCEDKIKQSKEIKNIFKNDKKVVIELIEILEQTSYIKETTYRARITFCFDKYDVSRRQVEFSFLIE